MVIVSHPESVDLQDEWITSSSTSIKVIRLPIS